MNDLAELERQETEFWEQRRRAFDLAVAEFVRCARPLWMWDDGNGGWVLERLHDELVAANVIRERSLKPKTATPRRAIPPRVRAEVWARDGLRCVDCGSTEDITIDHIIAVANGGTNDIDNLQTLCRSCNSKKGTRAA